MLLFGAWRACKFPSRLNLHGIETRRCLAAKAYEPLRILFCGSDEFSIASLRALREEQLRSSDRIASIDVVCRPGKRVGRGLKQIREVPIKAAATNLGLRVHEIDTFRGWTPPGLHNSPINLIIAVSFGLFVPPRILDSAKYGGLNVHPSLLPDLRGPAPLYHTIMRGLTKTGITVQTLHPERFDHGTILAQTTPPGIDIPNPEACTVEELLAFVAPKGAQMLVESIRNGLFIPPLEDVGWRRTVDEDSLIHAAKITPEDRHVDWNNWTWTDISRRNRAIGPLWSQALVLNETVGGTPVFQQKRIIFTGLEEVPTPPKECIPLSLVPGLPFVDGAPPFDAGQKKALCVFTRDGTFIRIREMKVQAQNSTDGFRAALKARMIGSRPMRLAGTLYTPFHNPLT